MLNLDTHILLFAFLGQLRTRERTLLSQRRWGISAIVLWEIAKLAQLGRITLDIDSPDYAMALSGVHVWPIDLAVCRTLRSLDFHGDPADEIIAATSVVHDVPLLTRDRIIRRSRIVPFAD